MSLYTYKTCVMKILEPVLKSARYTAEATKARGFIHPWKTTGCSFSPSWIISLG